MKRLQVMCVAALLSIATISSCSKEAPVNQQQAAASIVTNTGSEEMIYPVNIQGGKFDPETLYALPNNKVAWNNLDGVVHSVVSDDGRTINSGSIAPGSKYFFTTTELGWYPYHCGIHPNEHGVLSVVTR